MHHIWKWEENLRNLTQFVWDRRYRTVDGKSLKATVDFNKMCQISSFGKERKIRAPYRLTRPSTGTGAGMSGEESD